MDGNPSRPAERHELHRDSKAVQHRPEDGEEVRGIGNAAGVHIERTEAVEAGPVQGTDDAVVGGSAVLSAADSGEDPGAGLHGRHSIVREFVRNKKEQFNEKATVRFETMPGLQGQVDWAFFEDFKVLEEGQWKKLYCFLMVLGYSRMRYIEFVMDMSTSTLIRCHQNAFRYFGGYPEEILYDNMRQVVIKRLLKQEDSTLNRQFEDFAGFYGFKPILCRPYRGQTKGKVERTVAFVRDNSGGPGESADSLGWMAWLASSTTRWSISVVFTAKKTWLSTPRTTSPSKSGSASTSKTPCFPVKTS